MFQPPVLRGIGLGLKISNLDIPKEWGLKEYAQDHNSVSDDWIQKIFWPKKNYK